MPPKASAAWGRWLWPVAALCLIGAAIAAYVLVTSGSGPSYRTAVATTASVQSLLTLQGKAEPVDRATVSFGASGTVAALDVALGQQVSAGQILATLAPTSLQKAVTADTANLSAARATLTADEAKEQSGAAGSATVGSGSAGSASTGGTATVAKDQAAVTGAQQAVDADQQSAAADLAAAQSACGGSAKASTPKATTSSGGHPGGTPSGGSPASSSADTSQSSAGSATAPSGTATTEATCKSDLTTALQAQEQVTSAQKAVTKAESTLAQLLATESSSTGSSKDDTGQSGSGKQSSTASGTTSGQVTAATLATDQEAIDNDEATLIDAEQSLAAADLTSPIAGTVVAMGITAGESVSAGSSSAVITIISTGSFEASATLTPTQAAGVKIGDRATVSVVGSADPMTGTVTRVGPVDVNAGNTYPMLVSLPSGATGIFTGSSAEISVDLAQADDTLVVPTSAVHSDGLGHSYVDMLDGGSEHEVSVKVGVVGDVYTQVTSGVHRGDTVVLADVTAAVPTSTNTSPFGGVNALGGGATFTFHRFTGGGAASFAPAP